MQISASSVYQNKYNVDYIIKDPSTEAEWKEVFSFDHCPSIFRQGQRSNENFISSDFLYCDSDEGLTIDQFCKTFADYFFILYTSKSHQRIKKHDDGHISQPCDRFHVLFPQEVPYTDALILKRDLQYMQNQYSSWRDKNAKDSARFLYGNRDTMVIINNGNYYKQEPFGESVDFFKPETSETQSLEEHIPTDSRSWISDDVQESLDSKKLFLDPDNRAFALELLKKQAEKNRWGDNDSWMALRGALVREGFSLDDFIALSWPGANCAQEWARIDTTRSGATGWSIIKWCREIEADAFTAPWFALKKNESNPGDVLGLYFQENPTHGRACDVVFSVLSGLVVYEKYGFERGAFFKRKEGTCYWEPFDSVKTCIRAILEKAADDQFHIERAKPGADLQALGKHYCALLQKARTNDFLKSTVSLFSERVLVSPRVPWNMSPECLPCLDKVLDFSGSSIVARDAYEDEFFVNPVPCTSDDVLSAKPSPRFERFLNDLFIDKDTQRTARHCMALCISGSPSKTAQIWHNWAGDAGKNTVYDFLRELVPGRMSMLKSAIIAAKGDASEKRFGLCNAEGKTGIFFDEMSMEIDVSQVKSLTGLSEVKGEKKGRDQYEFQQTWSLVMLCNALPKFRPANDSAYLSRILVLPFSRVFYRDEADRLDKLAHGVPENVLALAGDKPEILRELMQERPAVLRDLILAWMDCRDNYNKTPFRSKECLAAASRYRKENDDVERFFDEYFERGQEYDFLPNSQIETLWIEFTGNKHFKGMRWLLCELTEKYAFLKKGRRGDGRCLLGLIEKEETQGKKVYTDVVPF